MIAKYKMNTNTPNELLEFICTNYKDGKEIYYENKSLKSHKPDLIIAYFDPHHNILEVRTGLNIK